MKKRSSIHSLVGGLLVTLTVFACQAPPQEPPPPEPQDCMCAKPSWIDGDFNVFNLIVRSTIPQQTGVTYSQLFNGEAQLQEPNPDCTYGGQDSCFFLDNNGCCFTEGESEFVRFAEWSYGQNDPATDDSAVCSQSAIDVRGIAAPVCPATPPSGPIPASCVAPDIFPTPTFEAVIARANDSPVLGYAFVDNACETYCKMKNNPCFFNCVPLDTVSQRGAFVSTDLGTGLPLTVEQKLTEAQRQAGGLNCPPCGPPS